LLLLVLQSVQLIASGTGESCDDGKGTCIDTDKSECFDGEGYVKTGYCAGPSNIKCCESSIDLPERCMSATGPDLLPGSYEFTLRNQGFNDGHSGALVYIPSTFDSVKSKGNLEIVVYIHGYENCIRNIVRRSEDACNCSAGQDIRDAYNLIDQFERASIDTNKTNRLFVAAEVEYDQASDNPGRWAEEGLFRAYLEELLHEHLSNVMKTKLSLEDIHRVRIYSHSGGYYVIGNMAAVGGLTPVVKELCLLDSLYADFAHFDDFVTSNLANFGTTNDEEYRFSSVYTADGGTYQNNVDMATRAKEWVKNAQCPEVYEFDNDGSIDLSAAQIQQYSLLFKLSPLTHNDIPRVNFYDFLLSAL